MTEILAPATVLQKTDDVLMTESEGVTVLMSMTTGNFIELNGSGAAIWEAIDGSQNQAAIIEHLQRTYQIGADQCAADVTEFSAQLLAEGLVQEAASA